MDIQFRALNFLSKLEINNKVTFRKPGWANNDRKCGEGGGWGGRGDVGDSELTEI